VSIYDFAMKMEQDGRSFYLAHAEKVSAPELKRILLELADDELKHYNLFKSMGEGHKAELTGSQQTHILSTVRNVFETMKAANKNYSFPAEAKKIWQEAQEVEKKSEKLYREKAEEVSAPDQKKVLHAIADEEHKHWVTLQNVIEFLDRPKHWLEDAEWTKLEEY